MRGTRRKKRKSCFLNTEIRFQMGKDSEFLHVEWEGDRLNSVSHLLAKRAHPRCPSSKSGIARAVRLRKSPKEEQRNATEAEKGEKNGKGDEKPSCPSPWPQQHRNSVISAESSQHAKEECDRSRIFAVEYLGGREE